MLIWAKKHRWLAALLVLGALLLASVLVSLFVPVVREICAYPEHGQKPDCAKHHLGPFVIWWLVVAADAHNGFITAAATTILTISTIMLWIATRNTARIAERTLTDLERPWVHITEAAIEGIFISPPYVIIEHVNFGRIVGTVQTIEAGFRVSRAAIEIADINPKERELDEVRNTLPPGKEYTSKVNFREYTDPAAAVLISAGDADVIFLGVLRYSGLTDTTYKTGFCFRYDAVRKCFLRHGGKKYNYTT